MIKKIAGIVVFLIGLWLILPISFLGKGYWVYLWGIAKGLGPLVLIILGVLIFYTGYMEKPKKKKK